MTPMNGLFFTPYVNRQLPVETKIAAADDFAGKITLLLLLAGVVVALFPRIVLTLLFSHRFAPAAAALSLFVIWQCLYQIVNVYLQLLIGLDDVAYFAMATVLGYAVAAAAFPTLIGSFGLGGAALALSVAMLVALAAALIRLRRRFGAAVSPLVMGRAAFSLAAIYLAGRLFDPVTETTLAGIGTRGAYGLLVVVLAALTLSRAERSLIAAGLARGRVRLTSRS